MGPQRLQHPSPRGPLAWLLLLLVLPGAAQGSFEVSVSPEAAVVEHGGSVWINCSTTCQDPGARGGIETSLTKTDRKNGSRWEAFRLDNITEWASTLKCFFTCGGNTTLAAANISAYRAPERVVLEPLPEMELGQAYNVTCWVLNVGPITHLTVTLRWGGQTLHTKTFQNHTGTGPDDITVTHEITPQRSDHGQEITCHTALDLTPHGLHFKNSSSALELKVYDLPEKPQLQTSLYIEVGTSATAHCRVAGVFPVAGEARFTLSFGGESLNFTVTTSGDTATAQGKVRSLSPGRRELNCTVTVGPVSRSAGQSVLVYQAPERVVLEPLPELELGRAYNLTCRVLKVAPVTRLTVTLRQGGRTLHTETFQSRNRTGPHDVTVTQEITPRRWDHGQQATCHAALDLTPHGPLLQNRSSAVELQEAESRMAKIIAISAIATVPAMLLGILAWGLARRGRTRRAARPEPGEATPSRTDFEMAQASAEDTPEEGGSLNSAEDASP